jgi:hypothetical protein
MPPRRAAAGPATRVSARPGLAPLRDRTFLTCALITFISGFVILGISVYLPLFFQLVRGVSPTGSGLRLLPLLATSVATGVTCGWLIGRRGRYKIFPMVGSAVATLGLALLSLVGPHTPEVLVQLSLVVVGIGMGGIGEVLVVVAQESVPRAELGVATATLGVFRSVGGVLGTAGLGAVFTGLVTARLDAASRGTPLSPGLVTGTTPARLAQLPAPTRDIVIHAYGSTLQTLLLIAAALYSVVFPLILLLPELTLGDRTRNAGTAPACLPDAEAPPGTNPPAPITAGTTDFPPPPATAPASPPDAAVTHRPDPPRPP